MSDFPPPPPPQPPPGYGPIGYSGPQMYLPSPRPTVVTVLAIIGIVWSSIQLLLTLFGLAVIPLMIAGKGPFQGLPMPGSWIAYTVISSVITVSLAVLLLVASIQNLKLKAWSRKGMMVWAGASIAVLIINTIIQVSGLNPQTAAIQARQQAQMQQFGNNPGAQNMMQISQSAGRYGSVCCVAVLLVYPIWILATYGSAPVKSAFGEPIA